jgi:hypothetical protein
MQCEICNKPADFEILVGQNRAFNPPLACCADCKQAGYFHDYLKSEGFTFRSLKLDNEPNQLEVKYPNEFYTGLPQPYQLTLF